MRKIFLIIFVCGMVMALSYYLALRPFEFTVKFETATTPGDLIETIRIWNRSLDNGQIIKVDSFFSLNQKIVLKNRVYEYDWHFKPIHDSLTKVIIQISEPSRRIQNKLLVPFTNQPIEMDAADMGKTFFEVINTHLKITRVKVIGEAQLDSSFCICRPLKTDQIAKANGMMKDYSLIVSFIDAHQLKVNGPPTIRVKKWNHKAGKLEFYFCFPLHQTDAIPPIDSMIFKKFNREFTLKAEYRGNYITSDRAWYQLMDYANRNGYKVLTTPIEIFHDNPNMGLNETNWKADIYLPIVEKH